MSILHEANQAITERGVAYGPADVMFRHIAERWSITLGQPVTARQAVLCMIDLKLARLVHDPAHRDSIVDVAGYAALLGEMSRGE